MLSIQSPQFSNSNKFDFSSKLSPLFRSKRAPSCQETCSHWNRANSCKKLESPSKAPEKNRKRSQNSQQRVKSKTNLSINHKIDEELNIVKNGYMEIKTAYEDCMVRKVKEDEELNLMRVEGKKVREENERLLKENEKLRNKTAFLEMEVERIKKESMKLIEIEQFKTQKLEESLIEKEKAISNFKQSFKLHQNVDVTPIHTADTDVHVIKMENQHNNSSIAYYESLTLSKDKTLTNSEFISISLTSMMESEDQSRQDLSTKRNNSSNAEIEKIGMHSKHTNSNDKNNRENESNKGSSNFKKFRKEMVKKIEVNLEERNKENINQASIKIPLDRKNSKSTKSSKSQFKRDEDENRSSKKKMMHR